MRFREIDDLGKFQSKNMEPSPSGSKLSNNTPQKFLKLAEFLSSFVVGYKDSSVVSMLSPRRAFAESVWAPIL